MNLDIRTLSVMSVAVAFTFAIGLFAVGRGQRRFIGLEWVGLSLLFEGAGFLLLAFRGQFGEVVSIVLANALIATGTPFCLAAVDQVRGLKLNRRWIVLAATVFLGTAVVFWITTFVAPDVRLRIVAISLIMGAQSLLVAVHLWNSQPRLSPATRLAFSVFSLFGAYLVARAAMTFALGPVPDFMSAGAVQATAFIAVMLFFTGKSFALVSLGLERLTNDLEKLAVVDDLTGLANRRALDTTLEREFRRQQRSGATLSVVLADLDHFKLVNDTYGHEAGDAVLKSVAHVLAKNVRKDIDLVGRFGGEEFMLILPETPGAQAKSLAERIRSQIETTKTAVNGAQIPVTCSLGVAEAPPDPAGPNEAREVLGRADEALYAAKRDGRNKVVRG